MYAWRGYEIHPARHSEDPNRMTLAVFSGKDAVATLTLGRDSSEGLLADRLYADELASLRAPETVVCEVTRLAVDPELSSRGTLDALFRATLLFGCKCFGGTEAVIEVNPRHVRFYERRFGFKQIGKERLCPRVNAPAVLLRQTLGGFSAVDAELDYLGTISGELANAALSRKVS